MYKDLKSILREVREQTHQSNASTHAPEQSSVRGTASSANKNWSGGIIVFSPGAASFEKFKNEFDRGEQFTKLAKEAFQHSL